MIPIWVCPSLRVYPVPPTQAGESVSGCLSVIQSGCGSQSAPLAALPALALFDDR